MQRNELDDTFKRPRDPVWEGDGGHESRESFQQRGWFGFVMLCNLTASIPISSN